MACSAAVTNVLDKVRKLQSLSSNDNFISAVEDKLRRLRKDLSRCNALIEEASRRRINGETLIELERRIMEVAYYAQDTIDSYVAESPGAITKILGSMTTVLDKFRMLTSDADDPTITSKIQRSMTTMLDKVTMLTADIYQITVDYPIEVTGKSSPVLCNKHENVIGFEDEEKKIIEYLTETREELDVISIVGMAGVGKTTLVRKIYTNEKTCYEFPIRIWVYVSGVFDERIVFSEILAYFTAYDAHMLDNYEMVRRVRGSLEDAKFLLVFDDVCSIDHWDAIQCVLPKSNCNGKVLVTSRYTDVGRYVNPTREPLYLGFLTAEQSWKLLQYEVFGSLKECPPELMGIRECVVGQCGGLPLAITHIGRKIVQILSSRMEMSATIGEWYTLSENLKYLNFEMEQKVMLDVVAPSYDMLPLRLRGCFLYMGAFPENYEIPARTLVDLWIAEGFIQPEGEKSLEKTAEEHLMDLVSRNLVMVAKTNAIGKVKTCRLHPLIHAFCRSKAAITELNLFHHITMSKARTTLELPSDVQKCYRICIHSNLLEFLSRKPSGEHLRSLLCFYEKPFILDSECVSTIVDTFSLLRVLATDSVKFAQFPKSVARLALLSYISLCGDDLNIPKEISKLQNLQTIVVDTKSVSLTINANIWMMDLLRHVKTKAAIFLDIQGNEGNAGENLQTLSRLSPDSCTMDVFNRARNLKKLGIRGRLATLDAECLKNLDSLENLKLVNDSLLGEETSQHQLPGLHYSALRYFPVNLTTLTLSATYLDWVHMSTLGKINTLQMLKLINYAFMGNTWSSTTVDPGFRNLYFLLIASTDLVLWEASANDFPNLRSLALKNCQNLEKLPMAVVKSLRKLDIENLSVTAVESARKIEKEKANGFEISIRGPGCE